MSGLVPDGLWVCKASGICFYVGWAPARAAGTWPAPSSAFPALPLPGPSTLLAPTRQNRCSSHPRGGRWGFFGFPWPSRALQKQPTLLPASETSADPARTTPQSTSRRHGSIWGRSADGQPRLFSKFINRNSLTCFQEKKKIEFPYQKSFTAMELL